MDIEDGLTFSAASVSATEIREENQYGGTRITLTGFLASAKIHLQFDLGIGDVVTPEPEWAVYPVVLEFAAPILRTYPRETAIAEKFKTMVSLGMVNSRMKDFADILVLLRNFDFEFALLQKAVMRTFARYELSMPTQFPECFSDEFAHSSTKQKQWMTFLAKVEIMDLPLEFFEVVAECSRFLLPLLFPTEAIPRQWIASDGFWKS